MKLTSGDGASVDLRPLAYQYPGIAAAGEHDWDANWLVINGEVRLPDGRGWAFSDPCLTTWEARALGDWLRAVGTGDVEPTDFGGDGEERLAVFTEPNVAVSLAERAGESAAVRVHFSLESRPPWLTSEVDLYDFFVRLDLPLQALSAAVDDWDRELSSFPVRETEPSPEQPEGGFLRAVVRSQRALSRHLRRNPRSS